MASDYLSRHAGTLGRPISLPLGEVAAFVAVNLLLVGACLFALRQNVKLRGEIAVDKALLTPAKGTLMPPLLGEDRTGETQSITFGQERRPALVYSFSMHCPSCQENWRAMHALQVLAPDSIRIIYIDTVHDTLSPEYLTSSGIGQSLVLVKLLPPSATAYDARAVPQLLLLDPDGRVQWSHMGELSTRDVSDVMSFVDRN